MSESSFLQPGTVLNNSYRLVRFIKSGGFGCTYEAVHVMLGQRVAIKEFFPHTFCDREATSGSLVVGTVNNQPIIDRLKKKFIDEARVLYSLHHKGIVHVSDVFEANNTAYFVMDYIEGHSLAEVLEKNGPIEQSTLIGYVHQLADALQYIHGLNRLHLDIKPENLMLNSKGEVLLIDFGTSKVYDTEFNQNNSTLVGMTPGYAPIEQMGNDVKNFTASTDIYSLGATIYRLLTGEVPVNSTLIASGSELVPLPDWVEPRLKEAVYAAMQIRKVDRPQSISEFLAILDGGNEAEVVATVQLDDDTPSEETNINVKTPDEQTKIVADTPAKPDPKPKPEPRPSKPVDIPRSAKQKKSGAGKKVLLTLLMIVLIAGVGLGVYFLLGSGGSNADAYEQPAGAAFPGNVVDYQVTNRNNITFTYTGSVNEDGMPVGQGHGVYEDGIYDGNYVDGVRQGHATFRTTSSTELNTTFEGTFDNDCYTDGRLTWDDGSYYVGTFTVNYTGNTEEQDFNNGTYYSKDGVIHIINGIYQ